MGETAGSDGQPLPHHRPDAPQARTGGTALTDTTLTGTALTIGELAARSGLSRGTLLYYDRIGVLPPSGRTPAGYRRYSAADATRLALIRRYRRAGLSLATIRDLLHGAAGDRTGTLAARLTALNEELRLVREQQRFILGLLGDDPRFESLPFLSRTTFLALFDSAGVTPEQRERWHAAFERLARDEHQMFLEFLGLHEDAIARIRQSSADQPPC